MTVIVRLPRIVAARGAPPSGAVAPADAPRPAVRTRRRRGDAARFPASTTIVLAAIAAASWFAVWHRERSSAEGIVARAERSDGSEEGVRR